MLSEPVVFKRVQLDLTGKLVTIWSRVRSQNSVTNSDQFQRQPRTAGNFTKPTVAHRIDHHNLKAVAMLTDLFS